MKAITLKSGGISGAAWVALVFGMLALFTGGEANAQRKYVDPFDPEVKRIADNAAQFLEGNSNGPIKYRAVAALALVEYYKRYNDGDVPKDINAINAAVSDVAAMVDRGHADISGNKEVYFPCIAMILLLEYDAVQYKDQGKKVLDILIARQLDTGSFSYLGETRPDTSQSQFAALAMFVAKQHRIPFDPQVSKKLLQFFVDYQAGNGSWNYRPNIGDSGTAGSVSIHSASASSVLLLADMLNLIPRVKSLAQQGSAGDRLPKNVSIYIPPRDEAGKNASIWETAGEPVVKFDRGKLRNCKSKAAGWYANSFEMPMNGSPHWNSYYMYALERYAYFKEQADGSPGSGLGSWYDQGVDYLAENQDDDGSFPLGFPSQIMTTTCNTGLSLLFLVRASEVISLPPIDANLAGGEGFGTGNIEQGEDGEVKSTDAAKSLSDLMDALSDEGLDDRALGEIKNALKRSIREFRQSDNQSKGDVKAFLETMLGAKNHIRRKIAITFLAGEQNMDNVPALIYALGDPNVEVALEAHNGLRLISRRFDDFKYVDTGDRDRNLEQFQELKRQWTRWFLSIRPDADLLD